jgi:hypothetical protein
MGKRLAAVASALAVIGSIVAVAGAVGGPGESSPSTILRPSTFSWLQPGGAANGWPTSRLPDSPARLPQPPGWSRERGDPGTRTEVLRGPSGRIAGYLNATPRQGTESPGDWTEFRVAHNREEGERGVRLLAAATGLRFRSAIGSCVLDSYRTEGGNRYREVACIVSGRTATTVIVGAAPPGRWRAEAPTIQRAIEDFTT